MSVGIHLGARTIRAARVESVDAGVAKVVRLASADASSTGLTGDAVAAAADGVGAGADDVAIVLDTGVASTWTLPQDVAATDSHRWIAEQLQLGGARAFLGATAVDGQQRTWLAATVDAGLLGAVTDACQQAGLQVAAFDLTITAVARACIRAAIGDASIRTHVHLDDAATMTAVGLRGVTPVWGVSRSTTDDPVAVADELIADVATHVSAASGGADAAMAVSTSGWPDPDWPRRLQAKTGHPTTRLAAQATIVETALQDLDEGARGEVAAMMAPAVGGAMLLATTRHDSDQS